MCPSLSHPVPAAHETLPGLHALSAPFVPTNLGHVAWDEAFPLLVGMAQLGEYTRTLTILRTESCDDLPTPGSRKVCALALTCLDPPCPIPLALALTLALALAPTLPMHLTLALALTLAPTPTLSRGAPSSSRPSWRRCSACAAPRCAHAGAIARRAAAPAALLR